MPAGIKIHVKVKSDPFAKSQETVERTLYHLEQAMYEWLETEYRSSVVLMVRSMLNHPTGMLANSFLTEVRTTGKRVIGSIFSNSRYAGIQDIGGTIVKKGKGFMTIPTDYVKTAAGKTKQSARYYTDTIVLFGKDGKDMGTPGGVIGGIFQKQGNDLIPLFWLVKKVTLPAHHFMDAALNRIEPFSQYVLHRVSDIFYG